MMNLSERNRTGGMCLACSFATEWLYPCLLAGLHGVFTAHVAAGWKWVHSLAGIAHSIHTVACECPMRVCFWTWSGCSCILLWCGSGYDYKQTPKGLPQ